MTLKREDFAPLLVMLLGALFVLGDCLYTSKTYYFVDLMAQFYPWREFLRENLLRGILPLWNPYSNFGVPFLASPQVGVFYPPNLLYFFLDYGLALKIEVGLHFFLGSLFMYLLLKSWGWDPWACLLGGCLYSFCSYTVLRLVFPSMFTALPWFPLAWLLLDSALERYSHGKFLLAILIFSIMILAGHPPTMLYVSLFLSLFALFFHNRKLFSSVAIFGLFLSGATLVALIQVAPVLELLPLSWRTEGVFRGMSIIGSLHLSNLRSLVFPLFCYNKFGLDPTQSWMHFTPIFISASSHYRSFFWVFGFATKTGCAGSCC